MKDKILYLRSLGYSYKQIAKELACSTSTVCYHLTPGAKEKSKSRVYRNREKFHPYLRKLERFINTETPCKKRKPVCNTRSLIRNKIKRFHNMKNNTSNKSTFTVDDVIKKFGQNPKCYLTGEPIDINSPRTYNFDHRIPRSRGGDNSLDNLELTTKQANISKSDMTPDEYINLCKKVLEHNGYIVSKASTQN